MYAKHVSGHGRIKLHNLLEDNFFQLPNTWDIKNTLINKLYIKHESKKKSQWKLYNIMNWMMVSKATYQNLWNAAEIVLRWKFITLNEYIRKEDRKPIL